MTLVRWYPGPNRDVTTFQDEVNRLFDNFFGRPVGRDDALFVPPVDIEETPDEFLLRVDLPGMTQKDVKVALMGDTLTIRGRRARDENSEGRNWHRTERVYGTFERSFALGGPVRNDKVKATFRDGVLEVHVPKAEEAKLREIEVQVA